MAKKDLAIKFSNDTYATKKDVQTYMKTPMVDSIWLDILDYRENFMFELDLKHITGTNYSVCLTPSINERINSFERKMMKLSFNYLKLVSTKTDIHYKRDSYGDILRTFAKKYNLILEDYEIQKILTDNIEAIRPDLMVVYHYYLTLKYIEKTTSEVFDATSLEEFIKIMQSTEQVNYRNTEIQNSYSRSIINKIYIGLPANAILSSLQNLFTFVKNDKVGIFIKALGTLYYLYYIQPFETYGEDLIIYAFKTVLAKEGLDELASTLIFENIIQNKDEFEKVFIESQRSLDLTYLLDYVLKLSDEVFENAFAHVNVAKNKVIANELYEVERNNDDLVPNLDDLENEVKVDSHVNVKSSNHGNLNFSQNIAIENVPTGLEENEASKLERHLLEMEPKLSRGQAYFYARHCTIDMNYTISQYKKEVGCAYETARSSMDNLVRLGYYRKELLKNKYVYIPVKR